MSSTRLFSCRDLLELAVVRHGVTSEKRDGRVASSSGSVAAPAAQATSQGPESETGLEFEGKARR